MKPEAGAAEAELKNPTTELGKRKRSELYTEAAVNGFKFIGVEKQIDRII